MTRSPLFYGFLWSFVISFKPSEPFFVDYGSASLGSRQIVIGSVLPVFTYASAATALLSALIASLTGSASAKPMILFGVLSGAITSVLWAVVPDSLLAMQASQLLVSFSFVGHVVLRAFLFRLVHPSQFRRLASMVRAGFLLGTLCSALLGQLLVNFADTSVTLLFVVSAVSQGACFLLTLFLPVSSSSSSPAASTGRAKSSSSTFPAKRAGAPCGVATAPAPAHSRTRTRTRTRSSAQTIDVVLYVLWTSVTVGVHTLVLTYWQGLFRQDAQDTPTGFALSAAYAAAVLASALPAFSGFSRFAQWSGTTLLLLLAALTASALLLLSLVSSAQLVAFIFIFLLYHASFELFTPLANAQIGILLSGKSDTEVEPSDPEVDPMTMPVVDQPRYTAVFSLNAALTTGVQLSLQTIVSNSSLFVNQLRSQFSLFSLVLFVSLTLFALSWAFIHIKNWKSKRRRTSAPLLVQ